MKTFIFSLLIFFSPSLVLHHAFADSSSLPSFEVFQNSSLTLASSDLFQNPSLVVARSNRKRKFRKRRDSSLSRVLRQVRNKKYIQASESLYNLILKERNPGKKNRLKYLLGSILFEMGFKQLASFQLIPIVKGGNSKYVKKSLEKISLVADHLGSDALLNYTISQLKIKDYPKIHKDILFFRLGEFQMANKQFVGAIKSFKKVPRSSPYYPKMLYALGLAFSELKQPEKAIKAFNILLNYKKSAYVTDEVRVAALLGKARAHYQAKQWDKAIAYYRQIPKDTKQWHESLFESSWAMLRGGKLRSAISNFQTLHSDYYLDFYIPESLLLRSIVYLYLCQYKEADKVLKVFTKNYDPVYKKLKKSLRKKNYYNEVAAYIAHPERKYTLPNLVLRKVSKNSAVSRAHKYIQKLKEEQMLYDKMPSYWKRSSLGRYADKILSKRISREKKNTDKKIRRALVAIKAELDDLFEQKELVYFETLESQKKNYSEIALGSGAKKKRRTIDEKTSRDYFLDNGYEYWPFNGEYWLDELGNYHYLGKKNCEK